MKYTEITNEIDGRKFIILETAPDEYRSFPADTQNTDFILFLQQAEKENDPYFTAWVEAGNDPDEFWTQGALNG